MSKSKKLFSGQIPFDLDENLLNYTNGYICLNYGQYDEHTKIWKYPKTEYRKEQNYDLSKYTILEGPKEFQECGGPNKYWWVKLSVIWKDNYKFESKMNFLGFGRGRSAAHAHIKDENNKEYTLFLVDLERLLKESTIKNGWTENLTWTFCKRGQNYGVMPIL